MLSVSVHCMGMHDARLLFVLFLGFSSGRLENIGGTESEHGIEHNNEQNSSQADCDRIECRDRSEVSLKLLSMILVAKNLLFGKRAVRFAEDDIDEYNDAGENGDIVSSHLSRRRSLCSDHRRAQRSRFRSLTNKS